MSHPEAVTMLANLREIVADPLATVEMRHNAIKHAYELGKMEGHYEGVAHACLELGKPRQVAS